jgi:hypothetical protein
MKLMHYVTCVTLGLCLVSCSGGNERKRAATVAGDCVKAMAVDNRAALRNLMTEQMYTDYVSARDQLQKTAALLATFGKKIPDLSKMELVSTSCERTEGDRAYVDVETRLGDKSQFEKMVMKKVGGNWKVAGKQ